MNTYPEPIDTDRVAKENFDIIERLVKQGADITYDEDSDSLFITIGHSANDALTEHVIDTIYYRIDPGTLKVVGLVILDFMSNILGKNKLARLAFGDEFTALRAKGGSTRVEGADAKRLAPLFQAVTPSRR